MAPDKLEYHRSYNRSRYHKRRAWMFALVGNQCVKCGSTNNLQIDHIDPKQKAIDLGKEWTKPQHELVTELAKCQALCEPCHQAKSIIDHGHQPAKNTHGTLSAYRYCKCELCRAANTAYMREWLRAKKK